MWNLTSEVARLQKRIVDPTKGDRDRQYSGASHTSKLDTFRFRVKGASALLKGQTITEA
jgi:hypothetical protein